MPIRLSLVQSFSPWWGKCTYAWGIGYWEEGWSKFIFVWRGFFSETGGSVHCLKYSLKFQGLNSHIYIYYLYTQYEFLPLLSPVSCPLCIGDFAPPWEMFFPKERLIGVGHLGVITLWLLASTHGQTITRFLGLEADGCGGGPPHRGQTPGAGCQRWRGRSTSRSPPASPPAPD